MTKDKKWTSNHKFNGNGRILSTAPQGSIEFFEEEEDFYEGNLPPPPPDPTTPTSLQTVMEKFTNSATLEISAPLHLTSTNGEGIEGAKPLPNTTGSLTSTLESGDKCKKELPLSAALRNNVGNSGSVVSGELYFMQGGGGKHIYRDVSGRSSRKEVKTYGCCVSGTTQCVLLSALYAEILIILCVAFTLSEIFTSAVPLYFYEVFYTFLFGGCLLVILYVYMCGVFAQSWNRKQDSMSQQPPNPSLFMRTGAIAFGMATLIHCGFELGQSLEVTFGTPCHSLFRSINALLQAIFTFMQMYFLFLHSQLRIRRCMSIARFGLMHIFATNVCIWLRTLARESVRNVSERNKETLESDFTEENLVLKQYEGIKWNASNPCQKEDIVGSLVISVGPYMYLCVVQYSLIAAAMIYIMWKSVGNEEDRITHNYVPYKVDCGSSSGGLFCGLFALVGSMICLILFFVLIPHEGQLARFAIFLSDCSHGALLTLGILTVACGFIRVQALEFDPYKADGPNGLLQTVTTLGVFLYAVLGIIVGALELFADVDKINEPQLLLLIVSGLTVVQVTVQSLFLADASRRWAASSSQQAAKPCRQILTFLMLINFTLWILAMAESRRVEVNPLQLNFYGFIPWTLAQRVCVPLIALYRFHSFAMLAQSWRDAYRPKPAPLATAT